MAFRSLGEEGEPPKEEKPTRVAASTPAWLVKSKDARRDENPEVEVFGTNHRRVEAFERTYSSAGGNRP
jgi:hypothetical protein